MSSVRHAEAQKCEDEVDSTWVSFFDEEEEKDKELLKAETKVDNVAQKSEGVNSKTAETENLDQETQRQTQDGHASESESQNGQEPDGQAKKRLRRTSKSKKGKKVASHPHHETKPPSVILYPKNAKNRVSSAQHRSNQIHDSMSDQGEIHHRGRKLQRRSQMKKYHSMEHSVDQAGRDRLEQKFVELQELLTRPLVADTRGITVAAGRQRVVWNPDDGSVGHGTAGKRVGTWVDQTFQEEEELGEDSKAYSTLRLLQTGGQSVQRHTSHRKQHTVISQTAHTNHHVTSKPPLPQRRRRGSVESSPTSSSGTSEIIRKPDRSPRTKNAYYSSDEEEKPMSPRRVHLPSDTHLKNSDSPELLEWLKRKDAEYRRNKKAERKKRREEKNNKMVENELKIARREKSAEKVQKWMEAKRKEAAVRHREEKRRRKEEKAKEEAARRARSPGEGAMKIQAIDVPSSAGRPQSAPSSGLKNYIFIKRPESAAASVAVVDTVEGAVPKPPNSKFVYKRPVSGRIRLMKLQKERNEIARKADQQRTEELTAEEKQKQARTSYDAWLVAKRREDMEKRREAKLQKEVNKSDPEMTTVITEMARKRIDRIKNGKKRIDTGLSIVDDDANSRFGGADFGHGVKKEEINEKHTVEVKGERDSNSVHRPSSYHLVVEGTAASLVELNMQAKLASAKTHMPIPQSAFSPRHRPPSAKVRQESAKSSGKVRQVLETDFSQQPNPFKLPFPDDLGVPEQVRRVQEKLFSKDLTASQQHSSLDERPEPQGCVNSDSTYPTGVDGVLPKHSSGDTGSGRSETTVRASLQLLQQIEAEAEKECVLNGVRSAFMTVANISLAGSAASPAKEIEEEIEEVIPDSADSEQDGDDRNEEPVSVEQETDIFKDESEDRELLKKKEDAKDENSKKADTQIIHEDTICGPLGALTDEAYVLSPPDVQKPFEKTQEVNTEPESITVPEDTEEADKSEEAEADNNDWDDATRKSSSKHVSFSEDLTTVFDPGSTETSSSFGDEREDGDKEMEYMTLDEAPDPEG